MTNVEKLQKYLDKYIDKLIDKTDVMLKTSVVDRIERVQKIIHQLEQNK